MSTKLLSIPPHPMQLGQHLIVDAWKVPSGLLNDAEHIERTLHAAVEAGGVTLIDLCVHRFSPYGVTATATLAESHMAIHTWPEHGYFAADLFFCGSADPRRAAEALVAGMEAREARFRELVRGVEPAGLGLRGAEHELVGAEA